MGITTRLLESWEVGMATQAEGSNGKQSGCCYVGGLKREAEWEHKEIEDVQIALTGSKLHCS